MTPTKPEKSTRTDCPRCHRMAAQLVRKVDGRYIGYVRPDGTRIYSCGFCGHEFDVKPDGSTTSGGAILAVACMACGRETSITVAPTGAGVVRVGGT